nr:type II secretion system protein [Duganella aquatilis]
MVAIIGMVTASTLKMGAVIQRGRAEQQLLDIGAAYSDALQSYADATPAGMPTQPRSLLELLRDPRFPGVRRHLRRIYVDPMTGGTEWGIVYLGDHVGVLAVYSLSDAKPVKIGNFPPRFAMLAGRQKISEWRFTAAGKTGASGSATPVSAAAGQVPLVPAAQPQLLTADIASAPADTAGPRHAVPETDEQARADAPPPAQEERSPASE